MPEIITESDGLQWIPLQSEDVLSDIGGKHRAGRFTIDDRYLFCHARQVSAVMSQVVILRCEHDAMGGKFLYSALSSHFRSIPKGEIVPEYQIIFTMKNGENNRLMFKEIVSHPPIQFPIKFIEE